MNESFLFSVLGAAFNSGNDLVYRKSSKGSQNQMLSFYFIASIFSMAIAALIAWLSGQGAVLFQSINILSGLVLGGVSFLTYLLYILSFRNHSTPISVTIFRLNLVPGTILAILLLGESTSLIRLIALALSVISILLMTGIKRGEPVSLRELKPLAFSLSACVLGGILNFLNKVAVMNHANSIDLLCWRFLIVSICSFVYLSISRQQSFVKGNILPGAMSGFFLLGSVFSSLQALKTGDVTTVMAVIQILGIVIITIVSWFVYKEKISRLQISGILTAILAVTLINL
jgi:drug/metabolite transporter (DMT)-like permease